jgi:hypothetical protein
VFDTPLVESDARDSVQERRSVIEILKNRALACSQDQTVPVPHNHLVVNNVAVGRAWRSLKHEDIYLKGYADGCEAKAGIAGWIAGLHQALGYRTPMAVWRAAATTSAVDMMDNAAVLPTSPQRQQQQTTALAA